MRTGYELELVSSGFSVDDDVVVDVAVAVVLPEVETRGSPNLETFQEEGDLVRQRWRSHPFPRLRSTSLVDRIGTHSLQEEHSRKGKSCVRLPSPRRSLTNPSSAFREANSESVQNGCSVKVLDVELGVVDDLGLGDDLDFEGVRTRKNGKNLSPSGGVARDDRLNHLRRLKRFHESERDQSCLEEEVELDSHSKRIPDL